MFTRLAEQLVELNMKCNNNKQCAEFDLGTAPWTSIHNYLNAMWLLNTFKTCK